MVGLLKETRKAASTGAWTEGLFWGFVKRVAQRVVWRIDARNAKVRDESEKRFEERRKGSDHLVVILAGYKPLLWPFTLERIARFAPSDVDVCLVSSGRYVDELAEIAQKNGWSYLSTTANEVAMAQNIAIELHPEAQFVYKLDEDIFVGNGFFEKLLEGYLNVKKDGLYLPGFAAPIINVNGYGHVRFVKAIGREKEYLQTFGELRSACCEVRAYRDGAAARWLWQHSLPFDRLVADFAEKGFSYSVCPHRFHIGAILFERSFWEQMGGMAVSNTAGLLGYDEQLLCEYCVTQSRVMIVIHNVFAGHFSFAPQSAAMNGYFDEMKDGLKIPSAEVLDSGVSSVMAS